MFVFAPGADSASVGRRSSSDLVLDWDDQVSRLHARFECQNGGWVLVDDGLSSNGTFVNERRLHGREPLRSGDVLRFGATQATYHAPRAAPPEPAPTVAPRQAPGVAPTVPPPPVPARPPVSAPPPV